MFDLQPLMVDTLPYPFNEEIRGIAAESGVPLGKKFIYYYVYIPIFIEPFPPEQCSVIFNKYSYKYKDINILFFKVR